MAINISFDWILDKLIDPDSVKFKGPPVELNPATHVRHQVPLPIVTDFYGRSTIQAPNHIQPIQRLVHRRTTANLVRLMSTKPWIVSLCPKSPVFPNESTTDQSECFWYLELTSIASTVALKLCLARAQEPNYYFSHITVSLSTNCNTILVSRSCKSIFHLKHHNEYVFENFTSKQALKYFQSDEPKTLLKISCKIYVEVEKCVFHAVPQEIPDFEKLLDDPEFSDFTIRTSRKEFKVHKIILTARSEVFCAMLKNEMKEKKERVVKITDFDDEVIEELIRYMYCGKVKNLDKLAEKLLRAADKYSIDSLKSFCLEEICKKLNVENALELFALVDYHKVDCLKAIILNFIVINIKKFDEPQFRLLANSKLSNEILLKLMKLIT